MGDSAILYLGMVCLLLTFIGVALTIREFSKMRSVDAPLDRKPVARLT